MNLDWTRNYIGIEFKPRGRDRSGLDCWGLLRLVMMEQYQIELPEFLDYTDSTDQQQIGPLIRENIGEWWSIQQGKEIPSDVALFRIGKEPAHVGIVVAPSHMLHVSSGACSCIESYHSPIWCSRLLGFWRHSGLALSGRANHGACASRA